MLVLMLMSCGSKSDVVVPEPSEEVSEPSEEVAEPSEEAGTDEDGDGITVEDGDCDDTSPWINPLMDEEAGDSVDNDCDGRIDEKWWGVDVSVYNPNDSSKI